MFSEKVEWLNLLKMKPKENYTEFKKKLNDLKLKLQTKYNSI